MNQILLPGHRKAAQGLGSCCNCGKVGPDVCNVLLLHFKAPTPGTGWGCHLCNLKSDGAMSVLCEDCFKAGENPRFICEGSPADNGRLPIEQMSTVPHNHNVYLHFAFSRPGRIQ